MNTPRQILHEQHQSADARLKQIQADVITQSLGSRPNKLRERDRSSLVELLWSELVLPARRIWLGYAFAWVMILAAWVVTADHSGIREEKGGMPNEAVVRWKEQQTILAELMKPSVRDPIDRPKSRPVSPRSEAWLISIG